MTKKTKQQDADYEVGYGWPPKATRFKTGQSGNPKGRPKKSRNFKTLLREELDKLITVREGNVEKRLSKREAMAKRIVQDAVGGDVRQQQFVAKIDDGSDEPEPFSVTAEDEAEVDARFARVKNGGADEDQSN